MTFTNSTPIIQGQTTVSCFSSVYIHPAVIALKITGMKMHNNRELLLHLTSSIWVCLHVWDKNVHFSQLKAVYKMMILL